MDGVYLGLEGLCRPAIECRLVRDEIRVRILKSAPQLACSLSLVEVPGIF